VFPEQIQLNSTTAFDGLREEEGEDVVTDGGGGRNRSTTIAIVLMPCDEEIPQDIMKRAFKVSLDEGKKARHPLPLPHAVHQMQSLR
jgi:hypothetical protein